LSDKWTGGATYEDFMGRWSRLLAPRFVSWLSVRPTLTISRCLGGRWLVAFAELQRQAVQRDEDAAVRALALEDQHRAPSRADRPGPRLAAVSL
jgi:hypothetical protein